MSSLGFYFADGIFSLPQDYTKALKLWHKAAELGHSTAYFNIGACCDTGTGVEVDNKKANHYYEVAAMGGVNKARHNLGCDEANKGNIDRAIKHYMIAIRNGDPHSLKRIQQSYSNGHATKNEYTKALQLYQEYLGQIKSVHRDKAAAYSESYRYY